MARKPPSERTTRLGTRRAAAPPAPSAGEPGAPAPATPPKRRPRRAPRSTIPAGPQPLGPPGPDGPGTSTPWTSNLRGPAGQLFGDPSPSPDETSFQVDNTSAAYYDSSYYTQHENDIEAVPMGPPAAPMALQDVVGPDFLAPITAGNKITFHVVGDTGASSKAEITTEASVADAMTADLQAAVADAPAFCFNLGDVIYNFGEAEYYYDQFYEPFRDYDRPIFAIPGNHDGAVTYTTGGTVPRRPLAPSVHRELL